MPSLNISKGTPWENGGVYCAEPSCPWSEELPGGPVGRGYTNALQAAQRHLADEPTHRVDAVVVRTLSATFRMDP